MESKKKIHGRVRGKFLSVSPVIDLDSEKKNELLKDIFNKKTTSAVEIVKRAPIRISKLERVALPVLVAVAVAVGWSLVFNLFFYKTKVDLRGEIDQTAINIFQTITKSISYLGSDIKVVTVAPHLNLSAGVGFLGGKIADMAEIGSLKTIALIESIK